MERFPEVDLALQKAVAASTLKAYKTAWSRWAQWAFEHNVSPTAPSTLAVSNYLASKVFEGDNGGFISVTKAAFGHFSVLYDFDNPMASLKVTRLSKGLDRVIQERKADNNVLPRAYKAFETQHIHSFMEIARQEDKFVIWRIVAAVVAAFSTFMRISETHGLRCRDIQIRHDAIHFHVKSAKRNLNGFTAFVPFTRDPSCFGGFIVDYLRKYDLKQDDFFVPALKRVRGGWDLNRQKQISQTAIRDGLKELISKIGLEKKNYCFHSTRRGATTAARKSGVCTDDVMALGRWKSASMVNLYTRHTEKDLKNLSKRWYK